MNAFKTLFDVCLLRAKPQDVPFSYPLLAAAAVASIITYVLALGPVGSEVGRVVGQEVSVAPLALAEHACFALTIWVLLKLRERSERFVQTLTAMFGVSTVVHLAMWPATANLATTQGTSRIFVFGLSIWMLIVYAHIFKDTLETRFGAGMLYTLATRVVAEVLAALLVALLISPTA